MTARRKPPRRVWKALPAHWTGALAGAHSAMDCAFGNTPRGKAGLAQSRRGGAKPPSSAPLRRDIPLFQAYWPINALTRAVKLQKRAARVGFDWPTTDEVLDKLREEMAELVEARDQLTAVEVAEEMGDLLFVMANLARHMGVDPEAALRGTNAKFQRRFGKIEDWLAEDGRTPDESDLTEMDALWNRAKAEEKASKR